MLLLNFEVLSKKCQVLNKDGCYKYQKLFIYVHNKHGNRNDVRNRKLKPVYLINVNKNSFSLLHLFLIVKQSKASLLIEQLNISNVSVPKLSPTSESVSLCQCLIIYSSHTKSHKPVWAPVSDRTHVISNSLLSTVRHETKSLYLNQMEAVFYLHTCHTQKI